MGDDQVKVTSWSIVRTQCLLYSVWHTHTHVCFLAWTKSLLLRKHLAFTSLLQTFIVYCLRRSNFRFLLFDIHNLKLWLLSFSFIFYLSCLFFFLSCFFSPHFFLFFTHLLLCLGYPFLTKKSSLLNVFLVVMNYVRINPVCENFTLI